MRLAQRELATIDEAAAALRQLSDADLCRLERIARLRAIGLNAVDWRDLLNEAFVRLLDGSRRWPREVKLVVFLRETMRSIASEYWRRLEDPLIVSESELNTDRETGAWAVGNASDWTTQPERKASAAEILDRIETAFSGDADALAVISGMVSGKSPAEIQEGACMNATRYASTQRRIRRCLARMFPNREELA